MNNTSVYSRWNSLNILLKEFLGVKPSSLQVFIANLHPHLKLLKNCFNGKADAVLMQNLKSSHHMFSSSMMNFDMPGNTQQNLAKNYKNAF